MKINILNKLARFLLILGILLAYNANAEIGGDFILKDYNDNKYHLYGSPKEKIIFFGFLNCPDICPATLSEVSNLLKKLRGLSKRIDPIFITVDPTRDKPALMKNYLSFFDDRIIGLTGSQDQIEKVANQYHVYYSYQDKGEKENYTVNHTANIYFLNKKNKIEKIFIPGTPLSEMFQYVNRYLMQDVKNLPLQ